MNLFKDKRKHRRHYKTILAIDEMDDITVELAGIPTKCRVVILEWSDKVEYRFCANTGNNIRDKFFCVTPREGVYVSTIQILKNGVVIIQLPLKGNTGRYINKGEDMSVPSPLTVTMDK